MPKKLHHIYADLETTNVKVPAKYSNYIDYYKAKNGKIPVPQIYSWAVGFSDNVFNSKLLNRSIRYYRKRNNRYYYCKKRKHHFYYGINGDSFIDFIEKLDKDYLMYFNNSKGFDSHFIIPLLDKAGYVNVLPYKIEEIVQLDKHQKKLYALRLVKIKNQIKADKKFKLKYEALEPFPKSQEALLKKEIQKRWKLLQPKEYSLLVNNNTQIYEIKIGLGKFKSNTSRTINRALIIRDSILLFPSSIAAMGKTLVKQNSTSKTPKKVIEELNDLYLKKDLSSNYEQYTLFKNFKEYDNTGNERDYLFQDVYILSAFHESMSKVFPKNSWKMTIGSTSYKQWVITFGNDILKRYLDNNLIEIVKLPKGAIRYKFIGKRNLHTTTAMKEALMKKVLPTKWLDDLVDPDSEYTYFDLLKPYMSGGIVKVNEKYRGQLVDNVTAVDINSSYPAQMSKDEFVPIGIPHKGKKKGYDFHFYEVTINKKIVNEDGLPFLWDSNRENREYLRILKPGQTFHFSSIAMKRFKKYYKPKKGDYNAKVILSFKQTPVKNIFGKFVHQWYAIKQEASTNGDEVKKFIAKLFLNSVFGKNATKDIRTSKIWNQQKVEWDSFTERIESKYYLPLGCVITEMGRMNLVDGVDHNYKNFVYCDTDSIFCKDFKEEDYKNMEFHPSKLGAWDKEIIGAKGIARRPKQYFFINDKKHKFAFAGIDTNKPMIKTKEEEGRIIDHLTLEDMIIGKEIPNQLSPYKILGTGIMLTTITKTIKPVWSYDLNVVNSRGKPIQNYPVQTEQIHIEKSDFMDSLHKIRKLKKMGV